MERNVKLLALHNFFTDLKFHSAVLILYFAYITGSYALGMSLFSVVMISSALFEIPTGIYSDRIGRKKTLIAGSIFAFLSAVFYAIGLGYWILFLGAIAEGVSRAFYSGNNTALLYDSLAASEKKDVYAEILGKTSSLFQFALAIGAVAGSIGASWSYPLIMWLTVFPQVMCILVSLQIFEPPRIMKSEENIYKHLGSSLKLLITHQKLRLVSLQDIFSFGINEATFQFRSAFIAVIWPLWAVGISKFLSFAGAAVSFWFSGRMIKRFGEIPSLLYARIYGRIVGLVTYGFPTLFSPVLISTTSLFYGTVTVASDSFTQKFLSQKERATVPSIVSFFGSIFFGIFSILLGGLADLTSPAMALLVSEILSCSTLLILWRLYTLSKSESEPPRSYTRGFYPDHKGEIPYRPAPQRHGTGTGIK